jgi:subtilisin family serine protease
MQLKSVFSPSVLLALTAVSLIGNVVGAEAAPHKANPGRCLVTVKNVLAAGKVGKGLKYKKLNPKSKSPIELAVVNLPLAVTSAGSVEAETMTDVCNNLAKKYPGEILSASPDFEVSVATTPNDPEFGSLYGMKKIRASEAWDVATDASTVVVGIVDTGIDYNHPDLKENIWTNPGEIAGNGIDDDQNGYVDDIHGYDFHNEDGDPLDDNGHGTHCAGTIGGVGNNNIGVAGVAWNVKMAGLKFLGASGGGYLSNAIRAINYATMMGFPITNNSWGGGGYSQVMYDAIKVAKDKGFLFVAAAGNSGLNADIIPMYPAAYNLSNIISVAATDQTDILAYFSNYGKVSVDVAAPGVGIYSTYMKGQYASLSGTSMATPHVSGVAALILGQYPDYSATALKDAILNNADYKSSLIDMVATSGRVNLFKSITNGDTGGSDDQGGFDLALYSEFSQSIAKTITPGTRLLLNLTNESGSPVRVQVKRAGFTCDLGEFNGDNSWSFKLGDKILQNFRKLRFIATQGAESVELLPPVESISPFNATSRENKLVSFTRICRRLGGAVK